MPPSLDKPGVRLGGVSETCAYNDHGECRVMGCGCTCHIPPPSNEEIEGKLEALANAAGKAEKACPKCGVKRPFTETFCRIDGERLASLLCGMCGAGMEVGDNFCWKCSSPKGSVSATPASIPANTPSVTDIITREIDYGKQITRGLQAELMEVQAGGGDSVHSDQEPQAVVEQPMGPQGSFKIVSRPNPNRIRGNERDARGGVSKTPKGPVGFRAPSRLPIKPS